MDILFIANSALLGVGLAMDAFSASLANGMNEHCMKKRKMLGIAGVFAGFQAAMPLVGWFCVHNLAKYFTAFQPLIPWIALLLLCFIGGKMILDGVREGGCEDGNTGVGIAALMLQGVATSIDALSVGFTIAEYDALSALVAALIIAAVTFVICLAGILIGRKFGMKLAGKAQLFGGVILILIGLEIFITGLL